MRRAVLAPLAALGLALVLGGCGSGSEAVSVPGAHPDAAPKVMEAFGCGSCHMIPGFPVDLRDTLWPTRRDHRGDRPAERVADQDQRREVQPVDQGDDGVGDA